MRARKPRPAEASSTAPAADRRRKPRARPTPKWLVEHEMDELARRRCLMILSVLSGERAVSEVIVEAGISRQSYYDLETRALHAMLKAVQPGTSSESAATSPEKRVAELELQVKKLQTDKRRAERLLLLTRKVMSTGPRKPGRVRPTRTRPSSKTHGDKPSGGSKRERVAKSSETPKRQENPSIPTTAGAAER